MADESAKDFADVLCAELAEVRPGSQPAKATVYEEAHEAQLMGLALSGGGIRSATFNLGVLQGLATLGLLSRFEYLSTVSGGGYIGGWLAAWFRRKGLASVKDGLRTDPTRGFGNESPQIRFLRELSNYLTPRKGLASLDTWSVVATYLRNLFLNLAILIPALVAFLLLPRVLLYYHRLAETLPGIVLLGISGFLACMAMSTATFEMFNLRYAPDRAQSPGRTVVALVILPLLLAAWFLAVWLSSSSGHRLETGSISTWIWVGALAYVVPWVFGWASGFIARRIERVPAPAGYSFRNEALNEVRLMVWGLMGGAVGGLFLASVADVVKGLSRHAAGFYWGGTPLVVALMSRDAREAATFLWGGWGTPVVVAAILAAGFLHTGLAASEFVDEQREWWSRLAGALILYASFLTVLFVLALYGPRWVKSLGQTTWVNPSLLATWAVTTVTGVLAGKKSTLAPKSSPGALDLVARASPVVFALGLLLTLSYGIDNALPHAKGLADRTFGVQSLSPAAFPAKFGILLHPGLGASYFLDLGDLIQDILPLSLLVLGLLSWAIAARVGANEFTMHALYRNRLVRCYLGASNDKRHPYGFTGLDARDNNIPLHTLVRDSPASNDLPRGYEGPYPIINTTLNLIHGGRLAWQQRKAASFVLTPKYCGYEVARPVSSMPGLVDNGYRPTSGYRGGLSLGTAMAISGAAASPSMGYHSSPPLAFLLTVFNVRLGRWLGNPRSERTWRNDGPRSGLLYLLCELFGLSNDRRRFVYLSDGGHFENLGIYELVRRRCRFIVACDAGEDHDMRFTDLGNVIEKCRADFGVDIEIDVSELRRAKHQGFSSRHCAVGKIRYDKAEEGAPVGTLVYLKASLTGDEPTDILRYATEHPTFPHQTTADQWFDESQFESYNTLGSHVVKSVFLAAGDPLSLEQMDDEELFVTLRQHWHPSSIAVSQSFTKHATAMEEIFTLIRRDPRLKFLDEQTYPESRVLTPNLPQRLWLPARPEEIRAGFYASNQMVQFMESVYLDLNLESEWNHPDNRGWINLFRRWAGSGMLRVTWAICCGTYGARFQRFCERRLNLDTGIVVIGKASEVPGTDAERRLLLEEGHLNGWLNPLEVDLLNSFFDANPPRQPEHLAPIQVLVEDPLGAHSADRKASFTVGFVVTRTEVGKGLAIRYLRVQNQVRRMGLARRALQKLISTQRRAGEAVFLDLGNIPTSAREVPSATMHNQFKQLFESAKAAAR
jgi:hypothetical protein